MRGLLWLVGAVLLLGSIDGGDTYEQLDDDTRDIVDQAINKANEKYGKKYHIDFHSVIYVPWVSCVACGENMACRPFRNQEKINELIKKCGSEFHTPYQHGGGHIMSDTMDEKNYGCLGCN
nr:uncharacterized protein LOC129442052 isoform X2 [Misgurnus anguillicaudatus]